MDEPTNPQFWDTRYRNGEVGWDLGQPAPPFVALLDGPDAPAPGTAISIGCGRGHDAIFFAQRGFKVLGVDFAHTAIEEARLLAEAAGADVEFEEADIFTLPQRYAGHFRYVIEHTCFAAISPKRREDYARTVHALLQPGGLYLAVFFAHDKWGGPPYSTTVEGVRDLFSPYFQIERLEHTVFSVPRREGQELFAIMQKS